MPLPANVNFCEVTGRFLRAVADSADPGKEPDGVPIADLKVKFLASLNPPVVRNLDNEVSIVIDPIVCATDDNGVLLGPDGTPGVLLVASDDADLDPHGWTWNVTVSGPSFSSITFSFVAPVDGKVDLSTVVPVPPNPGSQVPQWQAAVTATETARGEAVEAAGEAVAARGDAVAAAERAEAVPVTTDGIMAPILADPESQSGAQLRNTFAGPRVLASKASPTELIARAMDFGKGYLRVAVASDSILNDANDGLMKLLLRIRDLTPDTFGVRMKFFDPATQAYKAWTTIRAGAITPDVGGVVLSDDFNRTAAELVGSTASGGQVWEGTAGSWSADGSLAHCASAGSVPLAFDATTPDATLTTTLDVITATGGTGPQARLYVGAASAAVNVGSTDGAFVQFAVSTSGIPNVNIYKRIGGTLTSIIPGGSADFSTGLTSNSATPQKVTIEATIQIQNVTVTVTPEGGSPKVYECTISESDYAALGGYVGMTLAVNTGDYLRVDSTGAETPFTPGTFNGIEVFNGAVAGTNFPYQQARLETLYPSDTEFHILLAAGGANKGTATPAAFITEADAFLDAYATAHPESALLLSSQNPQFAPAPYVDAHAERQAAWRGYAMENGFEYLPVFEAFSAQEGGGVAFVQPGDGIHPTYPDYPNPTSGIYKLTWSGSVLWAQVFMEAVNARRIAAMPALTEMR